MYRFHESARIGGIPFGFDDIHISFWWIGGWRNGYGRASACDRSVVSEKELSDLAFSAAFLFSKSCSPTAEVIETFPDYRRNVYVKRNGSDRFTISMWRLGKIAPIAVAKIVP